MKQSASITILIAAGALFDARVPSAGAQGASSLTITVNVTSKASHDVPKGDGTKAIASGDKSTDKKMEITVLNRTQKELPELKLKYYWFVSEPDGKVISILRQDEKTIKVPASASTKVETKEVTIAFTAKKTKYENGKNVSTPATGNKYVGYGIRVVDKEGKLLGKKFDPPDLETHADEAAVIPEKK